MTDQEDEQLASLLQRMSHYRRPWQLVQVKKGRCNFAYYYIKEKICHRCAGGNGRGGGRPSGTLRRCPFNGEVGNILLATIHRFGAVIQGDRKCWIVGKLAGCSEAQGSEACVRILAARCKEPGMSDRRGGPAISA